MEKKTESGLVLSSSTDSSTFKQGKVVKVGPGKREDGIIITPEVKEGDNILFSYGESIIVRGEKLYLIKEEDVAVILKD